MRAPKLRSLTKKGIDECLDAICGNPPSDVNPEIAYESLAMLEEAL
jgi:hypothetical protein